MEPNEALAELLELSSQIEDVAIVGESGFVLASSGTPERGEQLAHVAAELVAAAGDVRGSGEVSRIEVSAGSSGLFVVSERGRLAVATTIVEPAAGLVIYDLRTALRRLDEVPADDPPAKPAPKPAKRRKRVSDA